MSDRSLREDRDKINNNTASIQVLKAVKTTIEKDIDELKKEIDEAKTHRCLKLDTLQRFETILTEVPQMRDELSSSKTFRNIFIGILGTVIVVTLTGIVAFANVRADTKVSKDKIVKIEGTIEKMKTEKNDLSKIIIRSLETIENKLKDE